MGKFFGLGSDGRDGHTRITRADGFEVHGGSKETHEHMQEVAIRLDEKLKRDGKDAHRISPEEFKDRLVEAYDKVGK